MQEAMDHVRTEHTLPHISGSDLSLPPWGGACPESGSAGRARGSEPTFSHGLGVIRLLGTVAMVDISEPPESRSRGGVGLGLGMGATP